MLYHYCGPKDIREATRTAPQGFRIDSPTAIEQWIRESEQRPEGGLVIATYVVDGNRAFRVADRHSEHVACAGGGPVLAAGEASFQRQKKEHIIVGLSNLSRGFCPEPDCVLAVVTALDRAHVSHPARLTEAYLFRRCQEVDCESGGEVQVVPLDGRWCKACGSPLPEQRNIEGAE